MNVFLTRQAEQNYDSIREYMRKEWGQSVAESFEEKVDYLFKLLTVFPQMGQVEKNDIRGFQISRQTRIFYRIKDERIIILSLFDVRQDPRKTHH